MLKHKQDAIYKMQNGAGQPHVYIKDIATLCFPLPPLAEQQKLVDALNNIQQSIKSAQDLIESLKSEGVYLFCLGVRNLSGKNWGMFVEHRRVELQALEIWNITMVILCGFKVVKCAKRICINLKKLLQNWVLKIRLLKFFQKIQCSWQCMEQPQGKLAF